MKIRAQIAMGHQSRQVHRVPHLFGDLQERLDQPRRHGIRLVQQRRDQARHWLPQGLGKPEALERRLGPQEERQDRARSAGNGGSREYFANPDLPEIDDYYEPFTFDYEHLQKAPEMSAMPTARPRSLISGERMEKIEWGPNWEEILGGEFARALAGLQFRRRTEGYLRPVRKYLHDVSAAAVRALPQSGLRRRLPLRCHLQTRGRRHRAHRSGQVPRLAHVRLRLSLQEDLLQLVERQIGEVHLLLSAHRGRTADGVLGDLRRPHSLSRRRAL